ncbi:MAG: DnaD domain protein [bacterium]|nr:DnaD domain protein [bacterium]
MKSNDILKILCGKNYVVNDSIIRNYHKLNITADELILLIYFINYSDKIVYNIETFINDLELDKLKIMELINNLHEKKIIDIKVESTTGKKMEEYIVLDAFYNKLIGLFLEENSEDNTNDSSIYDLFEQEVGRALSPMEYEIINGWIEDKFDNKLIKLALKEAIYNGTTNFRYIDTILYDWKKKGLKGKEDIIKDKEKRRKEKGKKVEVFDYNWLDDE